MGNGRRVTSREPDAGAYTLSNAAAPVADLQMNQYTRTPFDRREYDADGDLTVLQPGLANADRWHRAGAPGKSAMGNGRVPSRDLETHGPPVARSIRLVIGQIVDSTATFVDGTARS